MVLHPIGSISIAKVTINETSTNIVVIMAFSN